MSIAASVPQAFTRETSTIVQVFRDFAPSQRRLEIVTYLSQHLEISAREILDFRLSDQFLSFIEYARSTITSLLNGPDCAVDSACSDLDTCMRLLLLMTADYDFSFQFGDYGGHILLKQCQRLQPKLPVSVGNIVDEVIGSILDCGVQFPMPTSTSHKESVVKPLVFDFRVKSVMNISTDSSFDELSQVSKLKGAVDQAAAVDSIRVFVRQVPAGMHGAGQATVGYVMWSSAVIMSRW